MYMAWRQNKNNIQENYFDHEAQRAAKAVRCEVTSNFATFCNACHTIYAIGAGAYQISNPTTLAVKRYIQLL